MAILFYDNKIMFSFLFTIENGNRTLTQLLIRVISKYKIKKE